MSSSQHCVYNIIKDGDEVNVTRYSRRELQLMWRYFSPSDENANVILCYGFKHKANNGNQSQIN